MAMIVVFGSGSAGLSVPLRLTTLDLFVASLGQRLATSS